MLKELERKYGNISSKDINEVKKKSEEVNSY